MKMNNEDKKVLNQVFYRWLFASQTAWNYEKMQGLGYCFAMMPALRKIYKNADELQQAVKNHLQFFNCHIVTGQFILGANLAIEKAEGIKSKDAVAAIKTGLMGPLAGIGDTLFGVILNTVFGSIAAYMALEGNFIGCILWVIANVLKIALSKVFINAGYTQGAKLISSVGNVLKNITDSASILGLMVIGAMIPTVVGASTKFVYKSGEVELALQGILDKIMPNLLPVAIVALTYWLLGRKSMNSTKVIIFLIVFSVVCYNLGILG